MFQQKIKPKQKRKIHLTIFINMIIAPTRNTPFVCLDSRSGIMTFRGKSSPGSAMLFFLPIIKKLRAQLVEHRNNVVINIALVYFNTSSAKCLYDILKLLSHSRKHGTNVTVNWYYEVWDEDMKETGEDYETVVGMAFNHIACTSI